MHSTKPAADYFTPKWGYDILYHSLR